MTDVLAKKSLGQHWLFDKQALSAIVEAGEIKSNDTILEIGPGTGSLTQLLTNKAKQVIAVEYDSQLSDDLKSVVVSKNLEIINEDIRKFDLTSLPQDYKIVANIPYYLTAYLLRLLTETINQPKTAVLLVQKEVAERVAAKPGQMSFISVAVQLNYEVSVGQIVPAKLFKPPPKVDSQILILKKRKEKISKGLNSTSFLKYVKSGFASRRKTLVNNLQSFQNVDKKTIEDWLISINLKPTARAQELSLQNWCDLFRLVEKK